MHNRKLNSLSTSGLVKYFASALSHQHHSLVETRGARVMKMHPYP